MTGTAPNRALWKETIVRTERISQRPGSPECVITSVHVDWDLSKLLKVTSV
jgi:hypothetical protein